MRNTLGIDKTPAETRVVVAMSGGIDSSVTAALLQEQGYDVIGITLQLYDHGKTVSQPGACCAGQDIYDAKRVADQLGFPHYVLDYEDRFRKDVIENFADTYLAGATPIPCVRCNQTVKFRDLVAHARELDADVLATGHYVQIVDGDAGPELHRGANTAKDQSYFLFATTREQLSFLRFPLGELSKNETRAQAERFGLAIADKAESQDICFVPDGNYAEVVKKLRPGAVVAGEIVHLDGRVLGHHDGIINYTVGQRRGLNIGGGDPLYVIRLEPTTERVVVGPRESLLESTVYVTEINWLGNQPLEAYGADGIEVHVKLRSLQPLVAATVVGLPGNQADVTLLTAEAGVAPGQACVFYDGDRVLGGGWITRREEDDFPVTAANGGLDRIPA
ncbi:MAG: tRNA 2-thiouridine(34) synthase MnmA [Rhodospirillaceae bacterium]|jgi:tRNA-specific 2-thiouridylase|nr:tRNA 2-thiouridine(34) synthase MnmA [Rhodospirillaceae bacterium]